MRNLKLITLIAMLAFMLSGGIASAASENKELTKFPRKNLEVGVGENLFALLNDVDAPEVGVSLSLPGVKFDNCGIRIRNDRGMLLGEKLSEIFSLGRLVYAARNVATGEVTIEEAAVEVFYPPYELAAKIPNPNTSSYVESFIIRTRSGENISDAIRSIDDKHKITVIVESLSCDGIVKSNTK